MHQNTAGSSQQYVHSTEDLPVYEGFQPIEAKNIVYDSESGRIIDASYFRSGISASDVKKFYVETLPQLGWKKTKTSEYTRDGETLKINIKELKGAVYLKFIIRPAS